MLLVDNKLGFKHLHFKQIIPQIIICTSNHRLNVLCEFTTNTYTSIHLYRHLNALSRGLNILIRTYNILSLGLSKLFQAHDVLSCGLDVSFCLHIVLSHGLKILSCYFSKLITYISHTFLKTNHHVTSDAPYTTDTRQPFYYYFFFYPHGNTSQVTSVKATECLLCWLRFTKRFCMFYFHSSFHWPCDKTSLTFTQSKGVARNILFWTDKKKTFFRNKSLLFAMLLPHFGIKKKKPTLINASVFCICILQVVFFFLVKKNSTKQCKWSS